MSHQAFAEKGIMPPEHVRETNAPEYPLECPLRLKPDRVDRTAVLAGAWGMVYGAAIQVGEI